jgi:hypothetical protein
MGKTNRFAPFKSGSAGGLRRPSASGMAARKGEDPLAGLQRSQQHGPQGDAQFSARGYLDDWYDKL